MSKVAPSHRSADDLEGSLKFETLIAELSTRFINLTPGEVDHEIEDALRRVCELLRLDLAVLWQFSAADPGVIAPTHGYPSLWKTRGNEPLSQEHFPWVVEQIRAGRRVVLPSLDDLPAEGAVDRESARLSGIQSNLTLPLTVGGEPPVGALGFNTLRSRRAWPDAVVNRLELVAQVFTNALVRTRHEESRRESEERLALAADSAEAGLWTLDYGTGVFWATEQARTIFGYTPDEDITMDRFRESVQPDDWDRVLGAIERSRAGEPLDVEYRITPPGTGRVRWIHSRGRSARDPAGRVERLTGISFDVTERKTAEAESRSRLEFETLIADLSSRFINLPASDVDHEIEDALRRVCEPLGIDLAVLWQWSAAAREVIAPTHAYPSQGPMALPEPLRQDQYPWYAQQMWAGRQVAISSLEELPEEASVDRESSRLVGVKSTLCLPLSVGGEPPVGCVGFNALLEPRDWPDSVVTRLQLVAQVFTNALARMRYEKSLRESAVRLAAGADLGGLGFYEVDFGEQAAFFDERLRDLCGLPPEQDTGIEPVEFWVEHLHPDDRQRVSDQREKLHGGKLEQLAIEYRYLHPVHGEKWIDHAARVATRNATGRAIKTFGVLRDITERRQREEALRQSHAEIQSLKDRLEAESDYLKAEIEVVHPHGEVTGQSAAIQKVLRLVGQVAATDSSVLVQGETGSGKELVAQAIHRLSSRRKHLLVKVNCAALPSGLVESELFGREKGAFTGALTRQVGRFEVADGSTLFLDEIGELSLEVQAKLLRVLETGEFERLGSPRTIKVNVRLVAATHRNLVEDVRTGRFREDLYYRLNVFPIRVPPLRERAEDIPALVWTFLGELSSRMGKTITQVPRKTMEALQRQPWPGNVRELKNVIEHGAIVTTDETLRVPMIDEAASVGAPALTLAEGERALILRALERTAWRIKGPRGAATALGLKPSTLYTRMKKLGLWPRPQTEDGPE